MTELPTSPCSYKDPEGQPCSVPAERDGLCRWHDPEACKITTDDIQRIEAHFRSDLPLTGFQLAHAELSGINLSRTGEFSRADLRESDFYRADLSGAHLFDADLTNASLMKANLSNANLNLVNLDGANLLGVDFTKAKLEHINWGKQVLQETRAEKAAASKDHDKAKSLYAEAEEVYRNLRKEAEFRGHFQNAGRFFEKEMRMRRLQMPLFSFQRLLSKTVDLFCGYGEEPLRVVVFSMCMILSCALAYFGLGINESGKIISATTAENGLQLLEYFGSCLYFSVVTFTTLGYGDLTPIGPSRLLAAAEAFAGAFTLALFVVVFVKKMTR